MALKNYLFRYNGDLAGEHEDVAEGEMTYHEHLQQEDGNVCEADLDEGFRGPDGRFRVDAFLEDGNELSVFEDELTEVSAPYEAVSGPVQPAGGDAE